MTQVDFEVNIVKLSDTFNMDVSGLKVKHFFEGGLIKTPGIVVLLHPSEMGDSASLMSFKVQGIQVIRKRKSVFNG